MSPRRRKNRAARRWRYKHRVLNCVHGRPMGHLCPHCLVMVRSDGVQIIATTDETVVITGITG